MRRTRAVTVFAVLATVLSPPSYAQEKIFQIHGTVVSRDQGVPDFEVSLRAKGIAEERKTLTDRSGEFTFYSLPAGHYDLRVGHESVIVPPEPFLHVGLDVDRALTLILKMEASICTQMSRVSGLGVTHYLSLFDRGSDLTALRGTVKDKNGAPIEGAKVDLYIPKLGRIAAIRTKRDGSFSFARLKIDKNYWIQVSNKGYFAGEMTRLEIPPGYESVYDNLTLERCEPGHCEHHLRKIPIADFCD